MAIAIRTTAPLRRIDQKVIRVASGKMGKFSILIGVVVTHIHTAVIEKYTKLK